MSSDQMTIDPDVFKEHTPCLENLADLIMNRMASLSPAEIASILGVSNSLAIKAHNLAYDFSHKQTGYKAIFGFTGEAFRGLDAKTLSPEAIENAALNLRFISSVYGILKADDIIKPYRSEFTKEIAPGPSTPVKTFKSKVTVEVVRYIKENKTGDIINLLPGDADKCLDWKIIRAFSSVHKIVFQTFDSSGRLKTPITQRLKELRGIMARSIIENDIKSFQELTRFESPHFVFSPKDSKPLLPVFICE